VCAYLVLALPFLAMGMGELGPEDAATDQILSKYLTAKETQQAALRGAEMQVNIDAKLPRLEKQGTLKALRRISKFGQITYKALGFSGDNTIKNEVITRYLSAETESGNSAITPANYKFKYKGQVQQAGLTVNVFQITPRKKRVGMFRGELWLDEATAMPVREAGRLVKTPSVFLKKVDFINEYEIRDGVAIPKRFQSTADVRVFGRAELNIDFSNFARQEIAEDLANSSNR
jgi:hypothetical protein